MDKKEKINNIGLVGLGPVGMILSSHLQEAGLNITVCDHNKVKMNLIRNEGVILEGVIKKHVYFKNTCTSVEEFEGKNLDLVIFCTKSYQTKNTAVLLKKTIGTIPVVSAQNGIDVEEILAGAFGEENVLRLVINFAGNLNAPNIVKVTFFNPPNYIASINDNKKHIAEEIAEALNSQNLTTEVLDSFSIIKRIWEKTILNSSLSALCGIGKMTIKEAMSFRDTIEIVEQTIAEAVEVAEAEKIKFEDDFIRKCLRYLKKAGNHFPSLAVDLINNKPTEIDYMNGKIVEYGRKHYIKTPLNLMLNNLVKAMTDKNTTSILSSSSLIKLENGTERKNYTPQKPYKKNEPAYMGVDLGSSFTKFVIIDKDSNIIFKTVLKTLNRDRIAIKHILDAIHSEFNIMGSCATGYGRKYFADTEIAKTEINCAAKGVSKILTGEKCIIDIGGEDIKVIKCDEKGLVENFYLNDKCAAGTGAFITEISERAGIDIKEMSILAKQSNYNKPLNSFCTVFAKTEIMNWIFEGLPLQDIAKGIYLSIANRVAKMRIDTTIPVILIGGVIEHHPYFKDLLEKTLKTETKVMENPQYAVAYGAALMAMEHAKNQAKVLE